MPTVGSSGVEASLSRHTLLLVDARAPERFRGEVEPMDPVAGHIPGAVNRPASLNLTAEGDFKPAAKLRTEFAALLGGRTHADVVHHCGSGVTACHNILAMEIAGPARDAAVSRLVERVDREARAADRQSAALTRAARGRFLIAGRAGARVADRYASATRRILAIAHRAARRFGAHQRQPPDPPRQRVRRRVGERARRSPDQRDVRMERPRLDREALAAQSSQPAPHAAPRAAPARCCGAIQATPARGHSPTRSSASANASRGIASRIVVQRRNARALDSPRNASVRWTLCAGTARPPIAAASVARTLAERRRSASSGTRAKKTIAIAYLVGPASAGRTRQAEA